MLYGTDDEVKYYSNRAASELMLANKCEDQVAAKAHLALAKLHRSRSELSSALRNARRIGRPMQICRTDKEG